MNKKHIFTIIGGVCLVPSIVSVIYLYWVVAEWARYLWKSGFLLPGGN